MRNWIRRTVAVSAIALPALVLAPTVPVNASTASTGSATAAATRAYCGITWGSLTKVHDSTRSASLVTVRAGRHACYDRLVLEFSGKVDGYKVGYVPAVRMDGSGKVVPVAGGARLQLTVGAAAYDAKGKLTYRFGNPARLVNVTGYRTFRQVAWAGSFEGYTSIGLGVRARLPFRVFTLDGPGTHTRLVIDVAHRW